MRAGVRRNGERARPQTQRGRLTEGERPLWLFLTEPGLGPLLARELKFIDAVAAKAQFARFHLSNHDLLVLPDAAMRSRDAQPRIATNVLVAPVFGRERIGNAQLDLLARFAARENSDGFVSSVAGEQFSRRDFAPWLLRALESRKARVTPVPARPFWFIAVDDKFWFGFARFNHHDLEGRARVREREGSLPAVIAAAMVFAAKPGEKETIFDPTMGSGTILAEASRIAAGSVLVGHDVDPAAVAAAKKNLNAVSARIAQKDSARQPPPAGITLTIANLPFGDQFKVAGGNRALYADILRRSLERAAASWRAVLLTSDGDALSGAAREHGLVSTVVENIRVRGKAAAIHLITRK